MTRLLAPALLLLPALALADPACAGAFESTECTWHYVGRALWSAALPGTLAAFACIVVAALTERGAWRTVAGFLLMPLVAEAASFAVLAWVQPPDESARAITLPLAAAFGAGAAAFALWVRATRVSGP